MDRICRRNKEKKAQRLTANKHNCLIVFTGNIFLTKNLYFHRNKTFRFPATTPIGETLPAIISNDELKRSKIQIRFL